MRQQGFSLIEVLLALTLFSLTMLAALKFQVQSERQAEAGRLQILASAQMDFAAASVRSGNRFIEDWQAAVAEQLPQGRADLINQGDEEIISLSWLDPVSQKTIGLNYAVPVSKR